MVRHGEFPYLECSSRGDLRFSAFGARIKALGGVSIEEAYQGSKIFPNGVTGLPWRLAKGRTAVNQDELPEIYENLWRLYLSENPNLMPVLVAATGLSDVFGQPGHQCQATTLWKLRNEHLDKACVIISK